METQQQVAPSSGLTDRPSPIIPLDHAGHAAVIAPVTVRLPIHFFVFSVLWFTYGSILLPSMAPRAVRFFYQPGVLSLVHVFTLGFITSAMMGVMYRYVPALTRRPVAYPRLALFQFALYAIGVAGMVSHFALGSWTGLWWSAALVLASVILFAINLLPLLWVGLGRGVAETGMFAAIGFLVLAASLGLLMGIEEVRGFVLGNLVTSLDCHVTFAAIGWVTLTICAASHRFIPAFILPKKPLPRIALWQVVALAVATLGLGTSLLLRLPGVWGWSLVAAGTLLVYAIIMGTLVGSRRMAIDWSLGHALAGMLWLIIAIGLSQAVTWLGAWSVEGASLAGALVTAALLGWAGNFIIGMSYQLFPGFVARVRATLRFPALTIAELSVSRLRPFILLGFNAGVIAIAAAFIVRAPTLAAAGGWLVLGAVVPYTAIISWTLSFAYRASKTPSGPSLRIMPD
ncbi:MAG: hypothetical protein JO189_09445 [Deltaproteobacteria bacterium]|nr:hypothetical protein [Deltaproteobacteria bacterium]